MQEPELIFLPAEPRIQKLGKYLGSIPGAAEGNVSPDIEEEWERVAWE